MTTNHTAAFMDAVKGFPAHVVAKALGHFTRGIHWHACSKGHMAGRYSMAQQEGSTPMYRALLGLDLAALRSECQEITDQATARRAAIEQEERRRKDAARSLREAREKAEQERAADLAAVRRAIQDASPCGFASVQIVMTRDEFASLQRLTAQP